MNAITRVLDHSRTAVRTFMERLAILLNRISGGKLSPDAVTLIGLLAHVPIAWLIAQDYLLLAAPLLVLFGLLDALDGALARFQKRASTAGMLLDATTDRMKEVVLYVGIAYWFIAHNQEAGAVWAVAAIGGSLLVSYVKAKGETAVASSGLPHATVNRMFQDGLMRFEVRIAFLVIGLLLNQLLPVTIFIAALSWLTAVDRLLTISRKLKNGKN